MVQRKLFAMIVVVCFPGLAIAAEKARIWQTGTVLDSENTRYFVGTAGHATTTGTAQANGEYGTFQGNTNSSQTAVYRAYETFVIEGDTRVFQAQQRLKWRWSKRANLTVNAPVKFAVDKRKLLVIDDDGKEYEMEILKQVLKPATPPVQK